MGQFIKFVFASCLGLFLAMIVLLFVGFGVAGTAASSFTDNKVTVKPNSVLEINFDKEIPEKTNNVQMEEFSFENETTLGLQDMVEAIEHAKEDDNIKGIFLDATSASGGFATRSLLRDALIDFKESGKFVSAYADYYTQSGYYMASVADEVFVHPVGGGFGGPIDFRGFSVNRMFYKDALDKLGIKMNVYYVGKYKSATEPFRRNNMSEENREQINEFLQPIYNEFLQDVADNRSITVGELKNIADGWLIRTAEDAVNYKLADKIAYRDEAITSLKERMGLEDDDKIKKVSLSDYAGTVNNTDFSIKDKVAVVYAEGTITMGEGEPGSIQDRQYTKIIEKLRNNDKVKAIVLRVNSGGGSALASENIWREFTLAQKAGKPVVVSFGDVAASGGYYIACMADKIYAESNSITGSIGIFSVIPNASVLFKDKLGINIDTVNTARYASFPNILADQTEQEAAIFQQMTDNGYEIFLDRVAKGRNMTRDEVNKVAQGRVWTGEKAKELGLVDALGGLEDAIAHAAELAEIESYRVTEYPKTKEPIQQLIEKFIKPDETAKAAILKKELGELYPYYKDVQYLMNAKEPQARMPYTIQFN